MLLFFLLSRVSRQCNGSVLSEHTLVRLDLRIPVYSPWFLLSRTSFSTKVQNLCVMVIARLSDLPRYLNECLESRIVCIPAQMTAARVWSTKAE